VDFDAEIGAERNSKRGCLLGVESVSVMETDFRRGDAETLRSAQRGIQKEDVFSESRVFL
jgi:hypothetical protein